MIVPGPRQFTKVSRKTVTFDGSAGLGAAGTNVLVFTVTGEVVVDELVPFCTTSLTEATPTATITLGVAAAGKGALFIAATNAVDLDANDFWVDTGPDVAGVALPAALKQIVIGKDIIIFPAVQNVDGGVIEFTIYWHAISTDGNVS
jgi:hypothetical protein